MFGPFRLTNPLSGGLLWCAIPPTLELATLSLEDHDGDDPESNISPGKFPGACPATRSTDSASASDMWTALLRRSTTRSHGQG
jgi:hypothetical protein